MTCCREVLGKSVVGKCACVWGSVVDKCCGEVLQGRVVKKCCEGVVKWSRDVVWGSVV